MLKTCGYWLAFTTISDRQAISKNHHQLLDQRCWELSSPSQALPVLEVLLRSGTVVEGLERAARDSVCNMSPCMTRREQSLLQKVASMWGQSPSFSHSPSPSIDSASCINTTVLHGYDGACGGADVPDTMRELIASPAQLQQLTLPSCLILLEMVSSPRFQWVGPAPSGAALDLLLNYLRVQLNQLPQKALSWKVLWWLLQLVGEARPAPLSDVVLGSPSCAARLYSCCVRRLHEQWPLLTMEERLLSYLGLFEASHTRTTDRPVLVLHEMAHSLSRSPVDDFTPAPTQLLLRYSLQCTRTTPSPSFAQRSHLLELCYSWELHDRINTMDGGACLAAYSILTYMHRHCPVEDSLTVVEAEAWRTLHDRLHAQAFLCTSNYDADSCVRMLEQAEEINLSPWGLTVPSTFVEKLKRRIFALARQALRQAGAMPEYPDATLHILQAVLTCRQIGLRCTVLPFSDRDDCTAQHLTRELKQLLSDRVPAEGFGKK